MALGPFSPKDHLEITTLGLEFATAVALGTAGGYWAGIKFGSLPWFMIGGVFAGFALGMYILLKEARRMAQAEKTSKDK